MEALFPLGQIVVTPGALDALSRAGQTPDEFLRRHATGDWKELNAQRRGRKPLQPEAWLQGFE